MCVYNSNSSVAQENSMIYDSIISLVWRWLMWIYKCVGFMTAIASFVLYLSSADYSTFCLWQLKNILKKAT
jgi:hypothetical protein